MFGGGNESNSCQTVLMSKRGSRPVHPSADWKGDQSIQGHTLQRQFRVWSLSSLGSHTRAFVLSLLSRMFLLKVGKHHEGPRTAQGGC